MKKLKEFKPLLKYIKEDKWKIIIASIAIVVVELVNTLSGYLNGLFVEQITNLEFVKALTTISFYFVLCILFSVLINAKAYANLNKIELRISKKIGFDVYKKALDLPAYAYEKTSSGEIINRITDDSNSFSSSFRTLLDIFSYLVGCVIVIIYVFINSWIIALEIIIAIIILYFVIKYFSPKLIQIHKDRKSEKDKYSSIVNESIRGIREIKTLGIKKNLKHDVAKIINSVFNFSNNEIDMRTKNNIIMRIIRTSLEVIVFLTCGYLLYIGKTTLTFFIAMTYYVYRFMWLIDELKNFTETYQKLIVSLERLNEILENRLYEDEKFGKEVINNCKGIIKFNDVSFGYPNEELLLNHFNLEIMPNKKIAIVGKSGQGKSTLFNLITRIFDSTNGEIFIDDVNIKSLTEDELRKQISIIRQEPFIFNRSIYDNFKIMNDNITLKEIRKYTKMAFLDDYIMSLPNKYDTILGEGGVNLSGGQKQRLSIARTLAKKSKIILFDEATSALDNESQNYIKKSIDNLVKNHTVVIVAHRLSTIMDADIIYVVDKGQVVASGSHKQLLNNSEIYKKLYTTESFNS